jgi:hypothetical protein
MLEGTVVFECVELGGRGSGMVVSSLPFYLFSLDSCSRFLLAHSIMLRTCFGSVVTYPHILTNTLCYLVFHAIYITCHLHHMPSTSHAIYITCHLHHMPSTSHAIYITCHLHHIPSPSRAFPHPRLGPGARSASQPHPNGFANRGNGGVGQGGRGGSTVAAHDPNEGGRGAGAGEGLSSTKKGEQLPCRLARWMSLD